GENDLHRIKQICRLLALKVALAAISNTWRGDLLSRIRCRLSVTVVSSLKRSYFRSTVCPAESALFSSRLRSCPATKKLELMNSKHIRVSFIKDSPFDTRL